MPIRFVEIEDPKGHTKHRINKGATLFAVQFEGRRICYINVPDKHKEDLVAFLTELDGPYAIYELETFLASIGFSESSSTA